MPPVQLFLRHLQWRPAGSSQPEPLLALLGPRGCGKSTTLRALSQECGGTMVHATLDFDEHDDLKPIAAVALVAFSFMRTWTNLRQRPRFHRLGLSLLALNEQLDPDRTKAQEQIKGLIREYLQRQPAVRIGEKFPDALFKAADVAAALGGVSVLSVPSAVKDNAKPLIGALLRGAERWRMRGAKRWHRSIPEAEDASFVDALIALSTTRRADALGHVMQALLADIAEFTRRHQPARAACDCVLPPAARDQGHEHVWLLFLDHIEAAAGPQFLDALIRVKMGALAEATQTAESAAPLLVIAAADTWRSSWNRWWRVPWQTVPEDLPAVPLFSEASRDGWTGHLAAARTPPVSPAGIWYPTWLDAIPDDGSPTARLAAGHPGALDLLRQETGSPATILRSRGPDGVPLWERAANDCLRGPVPTQRPWPVVPPAAKVAAWLADPARRNDDVPPGTTATLDELRADLWISTFAARPSPLWHLAHNGAQPPAALHSWPARCLLAGLASDDGGAAWWDDVFAATAGAHATGGPDGALFRELARGRFTDVAGALAALFNTVDHRVWIRVLDDVTSAPRRLPRDESLAAAYRRLAPDFVTGQTPVEAAVTSLTALLWLWRDPLTVLGNLHGPGPGVPWHEQVRTDFGKLVHHSTRQDSSALHEAASQFEFLGG